MRSEAHAGFVQRIHVRVACADQHDPAPVGQAAFNRVAISVDICCRTWVKISGAYMDTKVGPPTYADSTKLAQAYVKAAPQRMVWGSDWPHPTEKNDAKPNDAALVDLLAEWAPEEKTRHRILVENRAGEDCHMVRHGHHDRRVHRPRSAFDRRLANRSRLVDAKLHDPAGLAHLDRQLSKEELDSAMGAFHVPHAGGARDAGAERPHGAVSKHAGHVVHGRAALRARDELSLSEDDREMVLGARLGSPGGQAACADPSAEGKPDRLATDRTQ